jgi:hypothetical protein
MRVKIFGHEPAAIVGVVEAFLALLLALNVVGLTGNTAALIMAAVTAAMGLATAAMTRDRLLSAVVGFAKAALALAIGYGLPLTDVQTSAAIGFVTVVAGLFLRTQTASLETKASRASAGTVADLVQEQTAILSRTREGIQQLQNATRRGAERGERGAVNIDPNSILGYALLALIIVAILALAGVV